jgi:hypothetical protein
MGGLETAGSRGGPGGFGSSEVGSENEATEDAEGDCKEGLFHMCFR